MKKFIILLTLLALFINCVYAENIKKVSKEYKVVTNDGFTIVSTLEYPKVKQKKEFYTVVLLHSLGYSSEWWDTLPTKLIENGYAVLEIDLRGHGKSIYNSKLSKVSWKNLTHKAYSKYPDDVISVIKYVQSENKRVFFNKWAIVGADIGAATAIYAANIIETPPQTIILISPVINAKGIYVPVKLAELNNIDILSITGTSDLDGNNANDYLKKFSQSAYIEYSSEAKSTGMLLFKHDKSLSNIISSWLSQYLK